MNSVDQAKGRRHGHEGVIVRLLLIAGASCSGKTELARRLQEILPEPWLFWESDRMQPIFPRPGEFAGRASEVRMLEANLQSIRAYLDAGFNVIGELWIWFPGGLRAASKAFAGVDVGIVRLECDLGVLERREAQRGSTFVGTARSQQESLTDAVPADLVLDSSSLSTHDLATEVAHWLTNSEGDGFRGNEDRTGTTDAPENSEAKATRLRRRPTRGIGRTGGW